MRDSLVRERGRRPVIGIPTDHTAEGQLTLPAAYAAVVAEAGGLPVLIPALAEPELTACWLERVDGLLLAGGADVDPNHYGEELALVRRSEEHTSELQSRENLVCRLL